MILEVSKALLVLPNDILGDSRQERITDARSVYRWVLKKNGFSISDIARLSGCNHATIIHSLKYIKNGLEVKDKKICEMIEKVKDIKR